MGGLPTLPKCASPEWELRWTASGQYNHAFRGHREEIRNSPFEFWYGFYGAVHSQYDMSGICMININDGLASIEQIDSM